MDSEKLATAKALFEAWWTSTLDSSAVEMGVFDLDGDLYRHTETRVTFAAFVAGMVAAQPAEQASAGSIGDDEKFMLLLSDFACDFAANFQSDAEKSRAEIIAYIDSCPRLAAPLAPSDTQGAEGAPFVSVDAALRQIIAADDAHALTQQLIEIGRAALTRQAPDAVRDAALEEAAAECEREHWYDGARQAGQAYNNAWDAAKAIRALKSTAPRPVTLPGTMMGQCQFSHPDTRKSTAPKLAEAGKGE